MAVYAATVTLDTPTPGRLGNTPMGVLSGTCNITNYNTTLAEISPFFVRSAVGLLPGTFEVEPEDGWEVMQATTPKLGLRIICTKQGAINDLSTKMRWDIDFGTVLTQPQFAGAMAFNQA